MTSPTPTPVRYIAKRAVADRYGVVVRTIDRWVENKVLPPPDRTINTRHYWNVATLVEHDRAQTVAAATKRAKRLVEDDAAAQLTNSPTS